MNDTIEINTRYLNDITIWDRNIKLKLNNHEYISGNYRATDYRYSFTKTCIIIKCRDKRRSLRHFQNDKKKEKKAMRYIYNRNIRYSTKMDWAMRRDDVNLNELKREKKRYIIRWLKTN